MSKVDAEKWEGLEVGRFWGVNFRENLPEGETVEIELWDHESKELIRYLRKYAKMKGYSGRSLSVFTDADFWMSKLDKLLHPEYIHPKGQLRFQLGVTDA